MDTIAQINAVIEFLQDSEDRVYTVEVDQDGVYTLESETRTVLKTKDAKWVLNVLEEIKDIVY